MIQPLQYQSMFVPTDLNIIQRGLDRRQMDYDKSLAQIAAMEDQFGQMQVDPSDIQAKQQVFGDFRNKIDQLAERYGGDYGAASKDIARELTSFRNNPFMQMAPYKRQLIEEARKREAVLGANALDVGRGTEYLRGLDVMSSSPEDFQYNILNRQDIANQFESDFGKLRNRTEKYPLEESLIPGMITLKSRKGIQNSEIQSYADRMYADAVNANPEILNSESAKEQVYNMAKSKAETLYQGSQYGFVQDPTYGGSSGTNTTSSPNTIITRTGVGGTPIGWSTEESSNMKNAYLDAKKNLDAAQRNVDHQFKYQKGDRSFATMKEQQAETDLLASRKREYEKAIKPFKGEMFDELTKPVKDGGYGMTEEQAIDAVIRNNPSRQPHTGYVRTTPDASSNLANALFANRSAILNKSSASKIVRKNPKGEVDQPFGNDANRNSKQVSELLSKGFGNGEGQIKNLEFNVKNKTIKLDSDDYSYEIPMSSIGDAQAAKNIDQYSKLMSLVEAKASKKVDGVVISGIKFSGEKSYNPVTGLYETRIYIHDENDTPQPVRHIGEINQLFFKGLADNYGLEPEYQQPKVKR